MYPWSSNLSQISLKNSCGKVCVCVWGVGGCVCVCVCFFFSFFFQILAEIEMTRNENRLFDRHFEAVQIFYFFFRNMVVITVYMYGVEIILKIPVGKRFS